MAFKPVARFYDWDDGQITEDIPTVLGFAEKTGGPVLELGVGTGRLALPLAEAGFDVTGVDISAEMLAIAAAKLAAAGQQERVELLEKDFTTLSFDRMFGLAYCGYNSFLHLIDTELQLQALRCWRQLLRADGLLVIDIANPHIGAYVAADGSLVLADQWTDPHSGAQVVKYQATEVDLADQVYNIHRLYDVVDVNGRVRRHSTTFRTRILFRRELEVLLHQAGYQAVRFLGDHDLDPWEPASPRIIAVVEP